MVLVQAKKMSAVVCSSSQLANAEHMRRGKCLLQGSVESQNILTL